MNEERLDYLASHYGLRASVQPGWHISDDFLMPLADRIDGTIETSLAGPVAHSPQYEPFWFIVTAFRSGLGLHPDIVSRYADYPLSGAMADSWLRCHITPAYADDFRANCLAVVELLERLAELWSSAEPFHDGTIESQEDMECVVRGTDMDLVNQYTFLDLKLHGLLIGFSDYLRGQAIAIGADPRRSTSSIGEDRGGPINDEFLKIWHSEADERPAKFTEELKIELNGLMELKDVFGVSEKNYKARAIGEANKGNIWLIGNGKRKKCSVFYAGRPGYEAAMRNLRRCGKRH